MPAGRPPVEIDLEQVELCGRFRATYETMAGLFGVSERLIKRRMTDKESEFCHHYKKGLSSMKMSLAEAQIKNAIDNNNATLQVWLGKQHLGQTDKQEIDNTHKVTTVNVIEKFE
jgi:hypothetical protein